MLEKTTYVIQLKDVVDEKWTFYFAPFALVNGPEGTTLVGQIHDQAELFGVLLKIRDLGIRLVSITPVRS